MSATEEITKLKLEVKKLQENVDELEFEKLGYMDTFAKMSSENIKLKHEISVYRDKTREEEAPKTSFRFGEVMIEDLPQRSRVQNVVSIITRSRGRRSIRLDNHS